MSVQDLRSNSQDTSAFYLANIYQVLADSNDIVPGTSNPSTAAIPPTFSPPGHAIWVNSLWFMSLVFSLSCGLLTTLLRQWARRYVVITQPARCRPEKRARMRAFFANGVDTRHIPLMLESLAAMLHLSLFLFFSGLVIFLFNINHSVFISVLSCIGLFSTTYGCITLMPIFFPESPFYTPFSSSTWLLFTSIQHTLLSSLVYVAQQTHSYRIYFHFRPLRDRYRHWVSVDIWKAIEETAMKRSSKIDLQILDWTMGASVDENTLEKYFGTIPGFVNSILVDIPDGDSTLAYHKRFWEVFCGFLGRTLSVDPVNEALKARRLVKCMNVMDVVPPPSHVSKLIYCITGERLGQVPLSVETGHTLARRFSNNNDRYSSQYAQYCVARVLIAGKNRDDRWFALANGQLGLSESPLRILLAYGDSIMLAVLLHMTRQVIRTKSSNREILSTFPQFDICDTLPDLQHKFCALWNKIVLKARKRANHSEISSLRGIRRFYIALHQDTEFALPAFSAPTPDVVGPLLRHPSLYPLCNITTHHPNSSYDTDTASLESSPLPGRSPASQPFPTPLIHGLPFTGPSTSQPISGEAHLVPELPSSLGYASHSQGSRSPPPIIVPARIPPEKTSEMATCDPENTKTPL